MKVLCSGALCLFEVALNLGRIMMTDSLSSSPTSTFKKKGGGEMELTSLFSLIASITHRGMILRAEYYREKGNPVRKAGSLVADTPLICVWQWISLVNG